MDFRQNNDDPPPKPYCDHNFEYSVYYEALKETYIARRYCDKCGDLTRKEMGTEDDSVSEWDEERIKKFIEGMSLGEVSKN